MRCALARADPDFVGIDLEGAPSGYSARPRAASSRACSRAIAWRSIDRSPLDPKTARRARVQQARALKRGKS